MACRRVKKNTAQVEVDACADGYDRQNSLDNRLMLKLLQRLKNKRFASSRLNRGAASLLVLAVLLGMSVTGMSAGFITSFDRDTISQGESATLTLTFEGGTPKGIPAIPAIANLRIQYTGYSSQTSFGGGQATASVSYMYQAVPAQPGEYSIPPLAAEVEGQNLQSQPIKLTVLKAGTPLPTSAANPQSGTLKLIVPKSEIYVGEILPVEIQLFVQLAQLSEMPHFKEEGFIVGKMPQPTQTSTVINNQRFNVLTFKTYVVAVKVGKLELGPATMSVNLPKPDSRYDFFGRPVDFQSFPLQSDPQSLQVLPLPSKDVPPGFNGAVGNYTLAMTVSPTNVAVGDPITVKVQISGRGALDSVTLPEQKSWDQFKHYPPTSEVQLGDPLGMTGTKSFALTVVPMSMETRELPAFSFSYFDPDQKAYRTLAQPAVPLTIRPSAASLPPPTLSDASNLMESNPPPAQDIVHIKPRLGMTTEARPLLIRQPWFITLQGIPLLGWISLLAIRKQKEKLANNPRLRRQRQVEVSIRNGLKELQQAAQGNQTEVFFATVFRLLQEQLGERLDLPASAITEAVIDERLRPLGVPEETLTLLRELFHACNQARYARHSTNQELLSLIPKVKTALDELKKIKA
ncbi:MAG: hypothetical protein JWQ71_3573 [Pedosphaera sp.]|nr:hypothetical protein [Pedosphaera sp.]